MDYPPTCDDDNDDVETYICINNSQLYIQSEMLKHTLHYLDTEILMCVHQSVNPHAHILIQLVSHARVFHSIHLQFGFFQSLHTPEKI